jgi:hypothetical protein
MASRPASTTAASAAGLVPVMALAEQASLSELITNRGEDRHDEGQVGGANPAAKLTSIVAGWP